MPLFMLISGYLFYNSNQKPFNIMVLDKLKNIGIPLCAFVFVLYLMSVIDPDSRNRTIAALFIGYLDKLRGSSMWFLVSCLYSMLLVGTIEHIFKRNNLASNLILISIVFVHFLFPDDFILATHKFVYPFFLIGYWMKQFGIGIENIKPNKYILITVAILTIIIVYFYDASKSIYVSGYAIYWRGAVEQIQNSLFRFLSACIVSILTVSFVNDLKWKTSIKKVLILLGKNTLGIYGFQTVFFVILMKLFKILNINIPPNPLTPIIFCITITLLCYIAIKIVKENQLLSCIFLGGRK